jgi:catechol 2,3-dioxygenase-like lactoylglutathione lyase family enzyme
MNQRIAHLALVVKDYDEAINFYTKKLGFELVEDTRVSDTKRWVLIKPKGEGTCSLLLAKAANIKQETTIGNQSGGRVFLFLHTDNFWLYYESLRQNNIKFVREPSEQEHGTVAVFEDLYGNLWDLIQPKTS